MSVICFANLVLRLCTPMPNPSLNADVPRAGAAAAAARRRRSDTRMAQRLVRGVDRAARSS